MNIYVNGAQQAISANNVADTLAELGWQGAHVATAVNGTFVPHNERASTKLSEGDRLEVLTAMQGG